MPPIISDSTKPTPVRVAASRLTRALFRSANLRGRRIQSMKFRLPTILMAVALIAVLLAWHVERRSRSNISGTWAYPTGDSTFNWTSTRYSDILTINSDGQFTKKQDFGITCDTYSGNVHTDESGLTTFHVTQVHRGSQFGSESTLNADYRFLCRCTVDSFGYLIVNEYLEWREHQEFDENTANVHWRSYRRR